MRHEPPRMSRAEIDARALAKRQIVLEFLASGEVCSTVDILSTLVQADRRRVGVTLAALERDGAVKAEELLVLSRRTKLWGITPHGLAIAGQFDAPAFELGRSNPAYLPHKLDCQRLRLAAEAAGWVDWIPERILRGQGLRKVPDALVTDPCGCRVAVEVERHCKTSKRYAELIVAYLLAIKENALREVHFVCPAGVARLVERSMQRVTEVRYAGETIQLTDAHRRRFKFYDFNSWPPERGS